MMCLGTAILQRVGRIVYACEDPYGGATNIQLDQLRKFYQKNIPIIEAGLLRETSLDMMIDYLEETRNGKQSKLLDAFRELKKAA